MHQHLRGRRAWRVDGYAHSPERARYVTDPVLLRSSEALGLDSVMFVPLPGRRRVIGSLMLSRKPGSVAFEEQDLRVAEDLGDVPG